ncbi:MAG: tetratricopeptide repeat protein [bacterium]|nr:tetratricopeptide repeat protein [bacterium]
MTRVAAWGFTVALLACLGAGTSLCAADAETLYRDGGRLLRERDYAAAQEAFEQVVKLEPRMTKAWLNLGIARAAQRNWEAAIEAYKGVLKVEPRHAKALNNIGNVYFRQGRYAESVDWYRRALEIDPDYILALYHYGWVLRQQNDSHEAETVLRHCIELEAATERERRTQIDCLFYVGTLRFRAEDYAIAAQTMEQVLGFHRAHAEARYYLGMAYRKLGRIEEAKQQLEIHRKLLAAARSSKPIEAQRDP